MTGENASTLLATLAQSSAAIVAIVGGFLVSRLVALSSEREGLRRQLASTRDRLSRVAEEYEETHRLRFERSSADFESFVLDDVVVREDGLDVEALLSDWVPRGSTAEEMRPVLHALMKRIDEIDSEVRDLIRSSDRTDLRLSDLEKRGLVVPAAERDRYEHVVDHIAENELPANRMSGYAGLAMPILRDSALVANDHGTASRRLDESIAQEQSLATSKAVLEADQRRIASDIEALGEPLGVVSAIVILTVYSVVGIVLPVVVMATSPDHLGALALVALVGSFVLGLLSVLGYMFWYARTLNDPIDDSA